MPYLSVTLADLHAQMAQRWDASVFWTQPEATRAVNEALRVWNLLTGYWKRRVVLDTVAGQVWYTVPGTLAVNLRANYNSVPLVLGSLAEWDRGQPSWQGETTTSGSGVPRRPWGIAPAGLTQFALWPADAIGGNSLALDGVRATPQLQAYGDVVDLSDDLMATLVGEALHIVTFKEGGARFASTVAFHRLLLAAAAEMNDALATSSIFRSALGTDAQPSQVMMRGGGSLATRPPAAPRGDA